MVIVIIGILATISTATYNGAIEDARNGRLTAEIKNKSTEVLALRVHSEAGNSTNQELMNAEFDLLDSVITLAREKEKNTLAEITGSTCSDCDCRGETFGGTLTSAEQDCIDTWNNLLTLFTSTTDVNISFLQTDPWGSPYLLDENEGDQPGDYCRQDNIFSAGPDRYHDVLVGPETVIGDGFQQRISFYDTEQCPS